MIVPLVLGVAIATAPPVLVDRASAVPGDVVTFHLRTSGPVRLYLAPVRATVHSRLDTRLRYLGTLRRSFGAFEIPAVNAGWYRIWCFPCAGRGPALRVTRSATCPATSGANDALRTWTDTASAAAHGDGTYSWKWYWEARSNRTDGPLFLSASRLDAPGHRASFGPIHRGVASAAPTWASVVFFPSAGCWRMTALLNGVSLVRVVAVR